MPKIGKITTIKKRDIYIISSIILHMNPVERGVSKDRKSLSNNSDNELTYNLLSAETRTNVSTLLSKQAPETLLLRSENQDLAIMLARRIARHYHPAKNDPYDIKEINPESDRYKIDEIKEKIIKPISVLPNHRHYLIINDADRMDRLSFDKLLKTIEEPTSPTTFIFITNNVSELPATINSRMERQINVKLSSKRELQSYLLMEGFAPEVVSEVVNYRNITPTMMELFLKDEKSLELYRMFINHKGWYDSDKPATAVNEILQLANNLASSLIAGEYKATSELTTPYGKAVLRDVLKKALDHRKILLNNKIRIITARYEKINKREDTKPSIGAAAAVERELRKVEQSELDLKQYINPRNVLFTLLSAEC